VIVHVNIVREQPTTVAADGMRQIMFATHHVSIIDLRVVVVVVSSTLSPLTIRLRDCPGILTENASSNRSRVRREGKETTTSTMMTLTIHHGIEKFQVTEELNQLEGQ